MFYSSVFSPPSALATDFRLTSLNECCFLKRGQTIVKRKRGERKNGWAGIATSSSPLPHSHPFCPRASNAICTANGGHFARARRRTKSLPDPWSMGVLRGAILRNVAAKPKMAGLAYEVSCIMVFCWVPVVMMVVGRRWGCDCVMGEGGQEEGRGKEEEFPISSPVTHGLSLLSSIFCSC